IAEAAGAWPQAFKDSRAWCVLTLRPGTEPVRALVEPFIRTWQFDPTDPRRETRQTEWIENLSQGRGTLRGLLDATQDRLQEQGQSKPPAFLLYIDQGEELYVRAERRERQRFSTILTEGLTDPRLRSLMSLRADFFGELQKDEPLYAVHRLLSVPPLREVQLREVVSRPAALLSARFETDHLAGDIAARAAEESTEDAGALPLLSHLLDDTWAQMVHRGDGVLRLPAQSIELGRVLVQRADAFLARNPNAEQKLRRIFTLNLATVREDGEPTRRRALRSEFSDEEWRLVSDLANHPNRLLVTAAPEADETYAEVAHEAIFRRWDKLREWIAAEREFLAWRSGLETARRAWQATPDLSKHEALLMGAALTQAQSWLAKRAEDLPAADREFMTQSIAREQKAQVLARRIRGAIYGLAAVVILGLIGVIYQASVIAGFRYAFVTLPYAYAQVWPHVLSKAKEQALKPGDLFKECARDCPEMVVVPAGSYTMGDATQVEQPEHAVTFAKPFAVSKYEVTFADWDACVAGGGCNGYKPVDQGWARGQQPVINVNWDDAQAYVAWLSLVTGKTYRLLTEAEFEYTARAGTTTAYPWGDDIKVNGQAMANCAGCGGKWGNQQTAPVGSFPPNKFGLYDIVGNVWEWTDDCVHKSYNGAPADGSAWLAKNGGDCSNRILRGGSWGNSPVSLRSALRSGGPTVIRGSSLGFRVGRTLLTP
ncbi:MAG TPA: formylglycine-generating enzyme family protein, partial [Xanthobacteraceae bacterium]